MPTDHLTALDELRADPSRFGLFAALRVLEQSFAEHPRLGESRKASDDALRLGQSPHLTFAPSDVVSFEATETGASLEQHSFGVFGPNGALPLHLTEHAYTRRHHSDDATFVDFLNVFQHRLISLFYRAWANSEPAASLDRPQGDRFVGYIGALTGVGQEGSLGRECVPDYARLCRAGLFSAQARSAEGLELILLDYFTLTVQVRQFTPAWLEIPAEQRCRLGRQEEHATLGAGATLGAASRQCQHKFEIVLGPVTLATFERFLPGRRALRELQALVRSYTNDEWTWQLRLLLRDVEIPGVRLARAGELGWTTWLGKRRDTADDVVIQAEAA
jgi:type VI secretion system protein ImpH